MAIFVCGVGICGGVQYAVTVDISVVMLYFGSALQFLLDLELG